MTAEEHEMWDGLNIAYEQAYRSNPLKIACIQECLKLLKPDARVLDAGCGTGIPVSQMLADAGMKVVGFDVAPKMAEHARKRVKGEFEVADMVSYKPQGQFDGIFVIYSQLGLGYEDFYNAAWKLAQTLKEGGIFVIGQSPADTIVPVDDPAWDETRSYVEGFNLPFWGEPFATLMLSRAGQAAFLTSMGLKVLYDSVDVFQPDHEKCDPENQQYIIARWEGGEPLRAPTPLPAQREQASMQT